MADTTSAQVKTENKPLSGREKYWHGHYSRWQQSGLSLAGYARSQGLVVNTFYGWHDRLKKRGLVKLEQATPVFHRVTIKPTEPLIAGSTDDGITSFRFRLPNGIDCEVAGIKPSNYTAFLETLARLRL